MAGSPEKPTTKEGNTQRPIHVVVIDDNPGITKIYKDVGNIFHHQLTFLDDLEQLNELFVAGSIPDVLILDGLGGAWRRGVEIAQPHSILTIVMSTDLQIVAEAVQMGISATGKENALDVFENLNATLNAFRQSQHGPTPGE